MTCDPSVWLPAPAGPAIYVLDASRSVPVAQSLVDKNKQQRQEYIDEIKEQYAELRDEFYAGLEDRKYLSLAAAQVSTLLGPCHTWTWRLSSNASRRCRVSSQAYCAYPFGRLAAAFCTL